MSLQLINILVLISSLMVETYMSIKIPTLMVNQVPLLKHLEVGEQYDKMMYPAVEESVIEYVDTMRHKTRAEEFFVDMFKK